MNTTVYSQAAKQEMRLLPTFEIFHKEGLGVLRAGITAKWRPYYALNDIFTALGTKNSKKIMSRLDEGGWWLVQEKGEQVLVGEQYEAWKICHLSKSKHSDDMAKWVLEEISSSLSKLKRSEDLFNAAYKKHPKSFYKLCQNLIGEGKKAKECKDYQIDILALITSHPSLSLRLQNEYANVSYKLAGSEIKESIYRAKVQAELQIAFEDKQRETLKL